MLENFELGRKINNNEIAHTVHAHGGKRGNKKIVTVEGDNKYFYIVESNTGHINGNNYATSLPIKDFKKYLELSLSDTDQWAAGA